MTEQIPKSLGLQENQLEQQKKLIEEKFQELQKAYLENQEDNFLNIVYVLAEKIMSTRAQYEIIEKYEKDPKATLEFYEIGRKNESHGRDGINVNAEKVFESIWIPGNFIKNDKKFLRGFQMISGDERGLIYVANGMGLIGAEETKTIVEKINVSIVNGHMKHWDREKDFLGDAEYRKIVREYLQTLMQYAKEVSGKLMDVDVLNESSKSVLLGENDQYSEEQKEYLKALKGLTSIYFDEVK